jgi:hypothetical protein
MNDIASVTAPSLGTLRHCNEVYLMDYTIPDTVTLGEAAKIIGTSRAKAKHLLLAYDAKRTALPNAHVRWYRTSVETVRKNYTLGKDVKDLTEI